MKDVQQELQDIGYSWRPFPRSPQVFFLASPWAEGMYGGAAGGGKTSALINDPVADLLKYPGSTAIFFRREYSQLEDVIQETQQLFTPMGAEYNESKHRWTFPGGSRYYLAHLQHEKNKLTYQGREFGIILFDELTQFTESMYLYLFSRNRDKNLPEERWRVRSATNPGGVGHGWVKRRFVDALEPYKYKYFFRYQNSEIVVPPSFPYGRSRFWVPATVKDNPIYSGGAYEANLMALDDEERRMLLDGDWDVFSGQFFYMWREAVHVIDYPAWLSPHWNYFGALDWGDVSPFCYLLGAVDEQKNLIILNEIYDIGWSIEKIATEIKKLESKLPVPVKARVADWNIFGKLPQEMEAGTDDNIDMMFRRHGISFLKANKNRIHGWAAMKEYLRWEDPATFNGDLASITRHPRMKITRECHNLRRTLPDMIYVGAEGSGRAKAEDLEKKGAEDHAVDTARYLVMHVYEPGPRKGGPKGWLEEIKEKAIASNGAPIAW